MIVESEVRAETLYYPSSNSLLTHTNRELLPVTIILPIAGETKASAPRMRRIALNPSQYQITSTTGADETKNDTETLYSDQSSMKKDGLKKDLNPSQYQIIGMTSDGFKTTKKIESKSGGLKKDQKTQQTTQKEQVSISKPREYSKNNHANTVPHAVSKHANDISEKQLLYSLVQAEAGNQDVDGCRLVADVVLNRMASNKFPSDMEGVIYSPGQFSVVRNGALKKSQGEISEKVIQAVDMELSGTKLNNDVLYFNNKPNGGWKYGDHYFK